MGQKWGKSEKMKTFAGHFFGFVWLNTSKFTLNVIKYQYLFGKKFCSI